MLLILHQQQQQPKNYYCFNIPHTLKSKLISLSKRSYYYYFWEQQQQPFGAGYNRPFFNYKIPNWLLPTGGLTTQKYYLLSFPPTITLRYLQVS